MAPAIAFIFSCDNSQLEGLSIQSDGANLPTIHDQNNPWSFVRAVPMSERDLRPFVDDPRLALANLESRGYHIARTPLVLELPHACRQSS
jgi:hypothetical protein